LGVESIAKAREWGLEVGPGAFAENITTEGINLLELPVGTRLRLGPEAVVEITQIGKECHTGCAIFQKTGKCIMPQEGVFARVLKGGWVAVGDEVVEEG
jgi:MOSC domain-containing protein YiiM